MKRIHYIFLIAALLIASCNRLSDESDLSQKKYPIEIGVSDEWSSLTKTIYNSTEDIPNGDGFVVWSLCVTDPEVSPQPTPEVIFGNNGTEVYAPLWTYSPTRYWQKGLYTFAAAIPSSAFNSNNLSGSFSEGILTIDCGTSGYNLADSQDDIMIAFADIDNMDSTMGTIMNGDTRKVAFTFEHLLSQISIAATNVDRGVDIIVQEVEIFGPHKSTAGPMVFTYNDGGITHDWSYSQLADGVSYKEFVLTAEQGTLPRSTPGATMNYKPLVSEVLVFPEECIMTIRVKYIATKFGVNSEPLYRSIAIPVDWQVGVNYAYKLRISSTDITFTSSILPWDDTSFDDIPHEFN